MHRRPMRQLAVLQPPGGRAPAVTRDSPSVCGGRPLGPLGSGRSPERSNERVRGADVRRRSLRRPPGRGERRHRQAAPRDAGSSAICYLDTGAWESYRPDADAFPEERDRQLDRLGGRALARHQKASWPKFARIIWKRLDLAKTLGCDGVEPDQNNPLGNDPGFPITRADQKAWYLEVARQAHRRGLSVGMKNGIETIDRDTVAAFDWALNEECFQYSECNALAPFVRANKAVFQVEYRAADGRLLPEGQQARIQLDAKASEPRRLERRVLVLTPETARNARAVDEKRPAAHGRTPLAVRWGLAAPSPPDFRPQQIVLGIVRIGTSEHRSLHANPDLERLCTVSRDRSSTGSSRSGTGHPSTGARNHPCTESQGSNQPSDRRLVALAVGLARSGGDLARAPTHDLRGSRERRRGNESWLHPIPAWGPDPDVAVGAGFGRGARERSGRQRPDDGERRARPRPRGGARPCGGRHGEGFAARRHAPARADEPRRAVRAEGGAHAAGQGEVRGGSPPPGRHADARGSGRGRHSSSPEARRQAEAEDRRADGDVLLREPERQPPTSAGSTPRRSSRARARRPTAARSSSASTSSASERATRAA